MKLPQVYPSNRQKGKSSSFILSLIYSLCFVACQEPSLMCGEGTVERLGSCVVDLLCSEGTHEENGECIPNIVCSEGTTEVEGQCISNVVCSEETSEVDGQCVPNVVCSEGTTEVNGRCVPNVVCSEGTSEVEGQCVPNLVCSEGTSEVDGRCIPNVVCSEGTSEVNGECVPNVVCSEGTSEVNGECVPNVVCSEGTSEVDGQCVPNVVCSEDTHEENGECVPNVVCSEDTHEENGLCMPNQVCGAETYEENGECVPLNPLNCGDGTYEADNLCLAEIQECGEGTDQIDQVCIPNVTCGERTIERGGVCIPRTEQWVRLPLPAGVSNTISQGHHGYFSHKDTSVWALDFPMPEGSTIVAARAGRIVAYREDSDSGCGDVSCANQANYIIVDHGDGTLGRYWHLELNGVLVNIGDQVCAGTPIGRSGNTGFSTGPHLHFEVVDLLGYSLPLRFESLTLSDGIAVANDEITSQTPQLEQGACEVSSDWSLCPSETFAHMGVRLEESSVPCSYATLDQTYTVRGRLLTTHSNVLLGRWSPLGGEWQYECYPVTETGEFAFDLRFDSANHSTYAYFLVGAARNEGCFPIQGWDASPRITLVP